MDLIVLFTVFYFFSNINQKKEIAMNVNVTYERNPGRVATFQDKIHHLPPKLATSDCCPLPNCTDTVNQANKTLEELALGSLKRSEPNFRYEVQGVSLNQVSKKNLFPSHTSTCCSDCRASQISSNFTPTNFDPRGNSNDSTGAPISFTSLIPLDGEQLGFNEFEGGNLKNGSVDTDI